MWYFENGKWILSKNSLETKIAEALENVLLWKHEAPFDDEGGIDWAAVLRGNVSAKLEADKILMPYRQFFDTIDIEETKDGETINLKIVFTIGSQIIQKELTLGA